MHENETGTRVVDSAHKHYPRVAVIVLNWNNPGDTIDCVASLRRLAYPAVDIIVVDNGSEDDSCAQIRGACGNCSLIENAQNLGFSEGNNIGIRHALEHGADFCLLLNNDTTVHARLVDELVAAHRKLTKPAFLGARLYYHEDPTRIWMGQPRWNGATGRFEHDQINVIDAHPGEDDPSEVDYVCGCAMFFSRALVADIGLMDARFFCYFEEVDWCYRARVLGYRHYEVPMARVWHKVSRASGGRESPLIRYFRTRNALLWAERHLSWQERWRVFRNTFRDSWQALAWQEEGLYWTLKRIQWSLVLLLRDPGMRAWRLALRDYVFRRFGDCPASVRNSRLASDVFATRDGAANERSRTQSHRGTKK